MGSGPFRTLWCEPLCRAWHALSNRSIGGPPAGLEGSEPDLLYTSPQQSCACTPTADGGIEGVRFGPFQASRGAADTTIR